jgi:UDPglucose 6-dehydrogenase
MSYLHSLSSGLFTSLNVESTTDASIVYDNCPRPAFVFDGRLMLDRKQLQNIGFTVKTIGTGDRV